MIIMAFYNITAARICETIFKGHSVQHDKQLIHKFAYCRVSLYCIINSVLMIYIDGMCLVVCPSVSCMYVY